MLTSDEMARIEEEERKRHAEEQYRAQVRANLQRVQPHPSKPASSAGKILAIALAAMVGLAIVVHVLSLSTRAAPSAEKERVISKNYVSKKDSIASGWIVIRHGSHAYYRVTITPDMRFPVFSGTFNGSGGSGNDIEAVVADETNYVNWSNGHESRVFWKTEGKETTGHFELRLVPGTYFLGLSNKFSAFSDKQVFLESSLTYQTPEK